MGRRRTPAADVLLPPRRRAAGPLPPAVPLLAGLGLLVLCVCTLPAVREQQHLERDHRRLEQETQATAADVERLRRELKDGSRQAYMGIKATRDLLHSGAAYIAERDARLEAEARARRQQPAKNP